MKLQISRNYLFRCSISPSIDWLSNKSETVEEWVINYAKINKIPFKFTDYIYSNGSSEEQIKLEFKSAGKYYAFLRIGNKNFPYFEFI